MLKAWRSARLLLCSKECLTSCLPLFRGWLLCLPGAAPAGASLFWSAVRGVQLQLCCSSIFAEQCRELWSSAEAAGSGHAQSPRRSAVKHFCGQWLGRCCTETCERLVQVQLPDHFNSCPTTLTSHAQHLVASPICLSARSSLLRAQPQCCPELRSLHSSFSLMPLSGAAAA